jgi:hypothetical protein
MIDAKTCRFLIYVEWDQIKIKRGKTLVFTWRMFRLHTMACVSTTHDGIPGWLPAAHIAIFVELSLTISAWQESERSDSSVWHGGRDRKDTYLEAW